MKPTRLAHRYAKALFALAVEQQLQETVGQDMMLIADTIDENKDLAMALKSPVIAFEKKEKVLRGIFGQHAHEVSLRFISMVARKGREEFLAYFAREFADIYKEYQGMIDAWVSTATPVEQEVREALTQYLQGVSGKKVLLHDKVNEALLGGFLLRMGDYQYDASISSMIQRLRHEFSDNLFVAKI